MAQFLRVRNWDKYQHYSEEKSVAWVKLHVKILDDPLVRSLDEVSQCHLFKIFALAGRRLNVLPGDPVCLGALIDAKSPVNIDVLHHWLEPSDGQPHIKSRRQSRPPSIYSNTLKDLKKKEGSAEGRKVNPRLTEDKEWVVENWNVLADKRGWPKCSRIPQGQTGEMLDARCKDEWWLDNYLQALSKLMVLKWPDAGAKKGLRISAMLRPDAVRAIIDGEWDDKPEERREGGSWALTEEEADLIMSQGVYGPELTPEPDESEKYLEEILAR